MWNHAVRTAIPFAALLATAALTCVAGEEELRTVFTDDFAEGISRWELEDEAGDVTMKWDSVEGSPQPGSLVLSLNKQVAVLDSFVVLGPCMNASPGERWYIDARAKKTGIGDCVVFVAQYRSLGCAGSRSTIGNTPYIEPGIWHDRGSGAPNFGTTHSVRPALLQYVTRDSDKMSCHFDSVAVSTDRAPAPTEIPVLTHLGLLILASVLALAAFVFSRRSAG